MASTFSKDVVNSIRVTGAHEKQVLLKVRFAEIDRSKIDAWGFNLFSLGAANTIGTAGTQQFGAIGLGEGKINTRASGSTTTTTTATTTNTTASFTLSDLLNIFVFRPDINLGATIKDLESRNVLQILAEPNLMAMSGQPAQFMAGGELPYPIVQPSTGGLTAVSIQFRPFGVRLDFTATVASNGTLRLKVAPEVSSLDYANAVTVSGFVLPAISTRRAETVVELQDGQSFAIAGLLDRRTSAQLSKVPGIGDLPIIGQLFRSRNVTRSNTELMVIVTPSIVDPLAAAVPAQAQPTMPMKPLDPASFDKKLPKSGGQ
jgi:pilus assembly protein CpaC